MKRNRNKIALLIAVSILSICNHLSAQKAFNVLPLNGNYSFNYNQVPENIVSINPALTGYTYQWYSYSSPTPVTSFNLISGATAASYSFGTSTLSQTTYFCRLATSISNPSLKYYSNVVKYSVVSVNWENINYLREHEVLIAGQTDWKVIDQLPIGSKLQTTTYIDGLDRPLQKVSRETSLQDPAQPNNLWGDVVKFYQYDVYGRQTKSYLPYTTTTLSGKYKTSPATDQSLYYSTKFNETAPFDKITTYDNSPLNRPFKTNQSGTNWTAADASLPTARPGSSVSYGLNTATGDAVPIMSIAYTAGALPQYVGIYPDNTLVRNEYSDENSNKVVEFIDKNGRVILKKTELTTTHLNAYDNWICTYNVYDDFGNLRFVMQPEAVKWLFANTWNFAVANGATVADEWCFRYEFDDQARNTVKKAPGAKELYMMYDARDRLVFMQDGNQRIITPTPQWTANLYDELDRTVITTLYNTTKTKTTLQTDINNAASATVSIVNPGTTTTDLVLNNRVAGITLYTAKNSVELVDDGTNYFIAGVNDNFEVKLDPLSAGQPVTVTTTIFKDPIPPVDLTNSAVTTILKYFFYDNYSFTTAKSFSSAFDNAQAYSSGADPIAKTLRTTNMVTGEMVRVLGTGKFLSTTYYYDEKGRGIQSQEDNIKEGLDISTSQFGFDGRLMSESQRHTASGSDYNNFAIITKNIFDKIGRVNSVQKKYGSNTFKTIANYDMDDLGRLKTKHLDPGYSNTTTGKTELESLTYSYNIHGNISGINKDYALKAGTYTKWGNYFGLCLGYDKNEAVFAATRKDNLVTGIAWNTQGDDAQRKYDFVYDAAGRLTNANYNERQNTGDAWSNTKMDFTVGGNGGKIQYDLNGNIIAMIQKGVVPGNSTPFVVDDLRYTYKAFSNKLVKVDDLDNLATNNGKLGDFNDGANATSDDYVYDDNGNLIIDLNKNATGVTGGVTTPIGTSGIRYNFLDKPEEIKITGKGTIKYVYDADGNRLQKLFTKDAATTTTVTTYISEFIYEQQSSATGDGKLALQFINFEEGRIRVMQPVSQNNGYDYLTIDGNMDLPGTQNNGAAGMRGAWDFFVTDYQGNVRMILTEETHVGSNSCTMETNRAANEEPVFGQVDANGVPTASNEVKARFAISGIPGQTTGAGWTNNTSSYVSKLSLAANKVGPNVLLKVMAGDEISANTMYYYQNAVSNTAGGTSILSNIVNSLVQAISGSGSTGLLKGNTAAITTQLNVQGSPFQGLAEPGYQDATGTAPKAYMTVLFFDERFNIITENSISKRVVSAGPNQINLTVAGQKAPKNGYCFVYLTNESNEVVYFDNLQVTQNHQRIVEENHYYAYGLKIAAISSRKLQDAAEGAVKNDFLYNDKELDDEADLNWYDYGFRNYDPQIGRFVQLDPLTWDYPELTNYQYASCDPISNIDVDGLEGFNSVQTLDAVVVTTAAKAAPKSFFSSVTSFFKSAAKTTVAFASGVVEGAVDAVKGAANVVLHPIATVTGVVHAVVNYKETWANIKQGAKEAWETVKSGDPEKIAHMVGKFAGNMAAGYGIGKVVSGVGGLAVKVLEDTRVGRVIKKLSGGCGCFVAGTLVLTDSGYKKIEQIKVGDIVWAYNDTTHMFATKKVVTIFEYERDTVYNIHIGETIIKATSDHPFFVGGKWVKVGLLKVGDNLVNYNNEKLRITEIEIVLGKNTVHNFEVEDFHTYYVSDDKVLVHNSVPCPNELSRKQGGKFTEPSLPEKTIVNENGVKIEHYTKSGDHGPPHAHVKGGGPETKIGQNGNPIDGSPELSPTQQRVVNNNKSLIRKAIKKIGRYNTYNNL